MQDRANSPHARDIRTHLHPFTNLAAHAETEPHIVVRGEGIHVYDDSGKRYIEGLAGLWCASLGFREVRLVEAAARQMACLPFSHEFAHKAVEPAIELAQYLFDHAPVPMGKVFFTNSGSEANDTQVKLVRALVKDTIALCPSLIITEPEIDDMFDRLTVALVDGTEFLDRAT